MLRLLIYKTAWEMDNMPHEEIEKTITIPLEEELQNVDELDSMTSISRQGGAFVWLKFETIPDDDFQIRLQDVRAAE